MKVEYRKVKKGNDYFYAVVNSTGKVNANGVLVTKKALLDSLKTFKKNHKNFVKHDKDCIGKIISMKPQKTKEGLAIKMKCEIKKDIPENLKLALQTGDMSVYSMNGEYMTFIVNGEGGKNGKQKNKNYKMATRR